MRLINAEDPKLLRELKFIREAEYQIYGRGSWGFTAKCEHAIEDAPTIQPEPHWIPTSERLPKKEGKYLCTRTATWGVDGKATKVTDIAILDYSDNIYDIWKDDGEIFQNGFAFGKMWQGKLDNVQKVSAWMPLPELYKEVTE